MSDTSSFKNKKLKRGLANTIAKARRAQQEVFTGNEVPTLVELAIDVVAANLILYPGLDGIEEDYIKKDIVKKWSRDIPVKVAAQHITLILIVISCIKMYFLFRKTTKSYK